MDSGVIGRPIRFSTPLSLRENGDSSTEDLVEAIYAQIFKRSADPSGLGNYAHALDAGSITVKEISRDLLHSEEWARRFIENRSVEETVIALYDCILARAPDVEAWNQITALEPQNGWGPIIDAMLDGAEYEARFGDDRSQDAQRAA